MHVVHPHFAAIGTRAVSFPDVIDKIGLKIDLFEIDPQAEKIGIKVFEAKNKLKDIVIMKASVFPYINVLWVGALVMFFGTIIAIINRIQQQRKS